jgi:hypothetical protein
VNCIVHDLFPDSVDDQYQVTLNRSASTALSSVGALKSDLGHPELQRSKTHEVPSDRNGALNHQAIVQILWRSEALAESMHVVGHLPGDLVRAVQH